jgi:hypothetical protein
MAAFLCWLPDLDETDNDGSTINANSPWHAAKEYARINADCIAYYDGAAIDVRDANGVILTFDVDPDGTVTGRMRGDE